MHAILGDDGERVVELLAADPSLAAAEGEQSPILTALFRGRAEPLGALLGTRPPVNVFEAAALGIDQLVGQYCFAQPELVTASTADGYTLLHLAAYFGHVTTATLLLECGADVAAVSRDDAEGTPLHAAAAGRQHALCWLLLAHGAPVDAQQTGGFTALHAAARYGDLAIVQLLVVNGADPWLEADDGKIAADIAYEFDHDAVAAYLRTHMA